MRKSLKITLASVIALLLVASGFLFYKYRDAATSYQRMKASDTESQARYGEAANAIAEIQDSLSAIAIGDTALQFAQDALQSEQQVSGARGEEVLARISVLKAGIQRAKLRIRDLESGLEQSGLKVAGLQRMIANLKKSVTEKEDQITVLAVRVDSLQTQVAGLTTEVAENQESLRTQAQTLEERRRELGTVYYLIGSKHELTTSGVVVAKGGLLGIGKTLVPTGAGSDSLFTAIDTDQESEIHIPAARARVLSAQPASSYQLEPKDGHLVLHILDPREFRKVKHLVILSA